MIPYPENKYKCPILLNNHAKSKISANAIDALFPYQKATFQSLFNLVERTIQLKESNSILLLGPPGSGKSFLLECILTQIKRQYERNSKFHVVKLHGMLHTNGQLAVKKVLRDLSMKDTNAENLASFEVSLLRLLEILFQRERNVIPIIFILDCFDLFTQHKNQNLLYNLFDISQTNACPIIVIGATSRMDVVEFLEKRVKSRYSHRQVQLTPDYEFPDFVKMTNMLINTPNSSNSTFTESSINDKTRNCLKSIYNCSKNINYYENVLVLSLSQVDSNNQNIFDNSAIIDAHKKINQDLTVELLKNLTQLEKWIVLAANKLKLQYPQRKLHFEATHNELEKLSKFSKAIKFLNKPIILKSFDHLLHLEIFYPMDSPGSQATKEMLTFILVPSKDQIKKGIIAVNCPADVIQWYNCIATE